MTFVVQCPTCLNDVIWSVVNPYRPFCQKQCQLIDLSEWINEKKPQHRHGDIAEGDD
ncbi:DNA gyrase inhibitor YacG [Candidatus Gillettellia adelgis]